jgi:hypothetical protein
MQIRRTKKIGNPKIAAGLKAARIAAGYRSGRAAALAHGWAESTYKAHESAIRSVSPEDAARYEKAFGIPEGNLLTAPDALLPSSEPDAKQLLDWERGVRRKAGHRLRLARYLRGFSNTNQVQTRFKAMNRATLAAHENGANAISARMAEIYGEAFAVNPHWLVDGRLPSGLGKRVDEQLARQRSWYWDPSQADHLAHLVDRAGLPLPTRIASLLEEIRRAPIRPSSEGQEAIVEYAPAAAYERRKSVAPKTARRRSERYWSLPEGLLSKAFGADSPDQVMIAVIDRATGRFSVGDRLFVDISKTDVLVPGRYCCVSPAGEMEIVEGGPAAMSPDGAVVLGQIIAAFCRQ